MTQPIYLINVPDDVTDTQLLDFLQSAGGYRGLKWVLRPSGTGKGLILYQDRKLGHASVREAIIEAIKCFVHTQASIDGYDL